VFVPRRPCPTPPRREHGIEVVYQDLALVDQQPVYMNLFLGRELTKGPFRVLDRRRMIAETERLVTELDVRIPSAHATISDLSGGQRQGIAIVLIISHSLDQVFRLSDRICVLRRGKQIGVRETAKTDKNEIVSMITGV
jgi:simple sugar transport system ATP-binding protein